MLYKCLLSARGLLVGTMLALLVVSALPTFACACIIVEVSGTKTVSGTFVPGGSVTYTVTFSNEGVDPQGDNAGNEFTDVLPAALSLVSANATSGTSVATIGTNTVTWNGSIPSGGSVTISITATIHSGTGGQTISNQGIIAYDADNNETNESSAVTDDPGVGGISDPTAFVVTNPTTLSINDVALSEGNSGATTFTFTVSLSDPAGVGGVTFNIATADGTATTADGDYVARSVTSQTIPQGSSSYTFDVTVNGDIRYEPNESFLVNVTSVTGATIADGQGVGTILNDEGSSVVVQPTEFTRVEGASASYQVSLVSIPSVTPITLRLDFNSLDLSVNGSASPVFLTFSSAAPQTVTVQVLANPGADANRTVVITHTISASSAAEYPVGAQGAAVTIHVGDVPPPPATPLCEDHNFDANGVVRTNAPDGTAFAINCRVLYQNGAPTSWLGDSLYSPASLGFDGALDLGVQQAVDLFSPSGMSYFDGGVVVCLRGEGTLIWLAASGMPRHPEIIGSYTVPDFPGFTCATLFEPGTLVLVTQDPLSR